MRSSRTLLGLLVRVMFLLQIHFQLLYQLQFQSERFWVCADCDTSAEFVELRVRRKAGVGDVSVSGAVTELIKQMLGYVQTAEKAPQTAQSRLHFKLKVTVESVISAQSYREQN